MDEIAHATDGDHGAEPAITPHAPAHGDGAGADAGHGGQGHGAALGPVDWPAWGAGLLGIAAGLLVAACLYLSTTL